MSLGRIHAIALNAAREAMRNRAFVGLMIGMIIMVIWLVRMTLVLFGALDDFRLVVSLAETALIILGTAVFILEGPILIERAATLIAMRRAEMVLDTTRRTMSCQFAARHRHEEPAAAATEE